MARVTSFTKTRSQAIEDQAIVGGEVVGDDLILTRFNEETLNAGNVRGPQGSQGDPGEVTDADLQAGLNAIGYFNNYTPVLTGMAVGTGGTNAGAYAWVGGPDVGDVGLLHILTRQIFGSSGQTFPTAPTISIPSDFIMLTPLQTYYIGFAYLSDANAAVNTRIHSITPSTTTTFRVVLTNNQQPATLSTTVPFTWAASDTIQCVIPAIVAQRI